jgi:hypothetical protein
MTNEARALTDKVDRLLTGQARIDEAVRGLDVSNDREHAEIKDSLDNLASQVRIQNGSVRDLQIWRGKINIAHKIAGSIVAFLLTASGITIAAINLF